MKFIIQILSIFLFISVISNQYVLDNFQDYQDWLLIQTTTETTYPTTVFSSVKGTHSNIVGDERDLVLAVTTAEMANRKVTTRVNSYALYWDYYNNDNAVSSYCLAQYDGKDNSSNFNPIGLGGLNFTDLSADKSFGLKINSNAGVSVNILVTDMEGGQSSTLLTLEDTRGQFVTWRLPFTRFTGSVDFSNVGGIEIQVQSEVESDVQFQSFILNGLLTSPSASPSPSHGASQSRTPTRVPTRSPAPYHHSYTVVYYYHSTWTSFFTSISTITSWTSWSSWSSGSSSSHMSAGTTLEVILFVSVAVILILGIVALIFFTVVYPRIKNRNQPASSPSSSPVSINGAVPNFPNADRDAFYL